MKQVFVALDNGAKIVNDITLYGPTDALFIIFIEQELVVAVDELLLLFRGKKDRWLFAAHSLGVLRHRRLQAPLRISTLGKFTFGLAKLILNSLPQVLPREDLLDNVVSAVF